MSREAGIVRKGVVMQEPFILSVEDRKICGVFHFPARENPSYVITCHGLFSSKQSEKFTAIADRFTRAGLAVVRFDFGGCGESSGSISDTTVSRRLQELEAVARFAADHPKLGRKFGLMGSSLGGFVALFFASANPVNALSIWATPYDLKEICSNIPEEELAILKKEFFTDAEKYNLSAILDKISTIQIIQGKKDETVPWSHAESIFNGVKDPKELEILPDADHSISRCNDRDRALRISLAWLRRQL
jgi:alpha-beta hydrolase superfamily lysophospholipase